MIGIFIIIIEKLKDKIRTIIYGFFLLIILNVTVQVNTEKYGTQEEAEGLSGYIELNGTIKTGNADKTEAGIDGRVDWKTINTSTFTVFESDYEWVNGSRSSDERLIHIRHIRKLVDDFSIEAFGQINYDKKLLIKNRELFGTGLRYKVLNFDKSDMSIGTAYMFEHENYDLPQSTVHSTEEKVSRWSNYISFFCILIQT